MFLSLTACSESALTFDKTRASAPTCAFSTPMGGAEVTEPILDLCIVVSDSDNTTVGVTWRTEPATAVTGADATTEEGTACATTEVEPGELVAVATVTDVDGLSDTCSVTVVRLEAEEGPEPIAPAVAIEPASPTTVDDLIAQLTTLPTDSDGVALDVAYTWRVDGETQSDLVDDTVPAARTARGQDWTVEAVATSGMGADATTIVNAPPTAPEVGLTPEEPIETLDGLQCLLVGEASDPDEDPLTYALSWQVDGMPWTGTTETTDMADDTIPVAVLDEDQEWTCSLVANDTITDGPAGTARTTVAERRFVGVSSGGFHACAWDDAGRVSCWGDDSDQQVSTTPDDTFVSVDASTRHSCGITDAEEVICWGVAGEHGQVSGTPTSLGWAVIGAAGSNNCAIDTGGALACWGNDDDRRSEPPGGSDYVEVAGGVSFLCANDSGGSVTCWGEPAHGVGDGPGEVLIGLSAGNHMCGIRPSDGGAVCWGLDTDGQTIPPSGAFDVVTAGQFHSCGLRTDGTIACWGSDFVGESSAPAGTFLDVSAGSHIPDTEDYFTCGVDTEHELHCWGSDASGQQAQIPGGM